LALRAWTSLRSRRARRSRCPPVRWMCG